MESELVQFAKHIEQSVPRRSNDSLIKLYAHLYNFRFRYADKITYRAYARLQRWIEVVEEELASRKMKVKSVTNVTAK